MKYQSLTSLLTSVSMQSKGLIAVRLSEMTFGPGLSDRPIRSLNVAESAELPHFRPSVGGYGLALVTIAHLAHGRVKRGSNF
jgi:hypothetical protein